MPFARVEKPQGLDAPVASLETIDFGRLLSQEPEELSKLLRVSEDFGFFYLDFRGLDGRRVVDDYRSVRELYKRFCSHALSEKNELGLISQEHGYQPVGKFAGVMENKRDGYEILRVSRDHLALDDPNLPLIVSSPADIATISNFVASANIATKTILASLSTAMNLPKDARFETLHRNEHKSNSTLALLHYPPIHDAAASRDVGHQVHTDIGSLTLLFCDEWGLQAQAPGAGSSFAYIEPRPGLAVVNVGDSLRFASGHRLNSCVHQVVPVPGQAEDRYSICYFLRPENEAKYRDSEGRLITAREWHDGKYKVFEAQHKEQRQSVLLGGMKEQLGDVALAAVAA
ncbi:unnamed protein product [Discula destructiva]